MLRHRQPASLGVCLSSTKRCFETDVFATACDILKWNDAADAYDLYEVKSSTSEAKKDKNELYTYDLAFQSEVLARCGVPLGRLSIMRLNTHYERKDELDLDQLFASEDFSERVAKVKRSRGSDMELAYNLLVSKNNRRDHAAAFTEDAARTARPSTTSTRKFPTTASTT